MRAILVPMVLAVGVTTLSQSSPPASAKGCLKGAVIGGVAGHFAGHHGVLGAGAGCIIGHHEANKHARERERAYDHDGPRHREGYGSSAPAYDRDYGPR
ncbi:MAG TPA: hypothetical protein VN890_04945 [Methylocella sp.]|nr:hypothetical protein [Methylocella sp.]